MSLTHCVSCCVAAALRIYYLYTVLNLVIRSSNYSKVCKYTYSLAVEILQQLINADLQSTQFLFIIIEPNCTLVAGNLPAIGPFLHRVKALDNFVVGFRSLGSCYSRSSSETKLNRNNSDSESKGADVTVSRANSFPIISQPGPVDDMRDLHKGMGYSQTVVTAQTSRPSVEIDSSHLNNGQILVTRGVDVTRD